MSGLPWWVTAAAGLFAAVFAIMQLATHGADGVFAVLAFISIAFFAASFSRDGALRELLTWLGINFPWR